MRLTDIKITIMTEYLVFGSQRTITGYNYEMSMPMLSMGSVCFMHLKFLCQNVIISYDKMSVLLPDLF